MADIVIAVAAKVAEYLVDPILRPLGYLFNHRGNFDSLEETVEKLGDARERLQRDVDEVDRQGDKIVPDVQKWLTRTEGITQKALELIEEDEKAANTSCLNLKLRYQRSRQAQKQSSDIVEMIQEEYKFYRVSYRLLPPRIWSLHLRDCVALESRASILNEIMEALRNDDIRMIGVWGEGGVGKTTLAIQVAKKAEEDKLFEKVVMVLNISPDPDVTEIQDKIAIMLGLEFKEKEESGRAARLSKSLQENTTVLVILDDIWEGLSLKNIGIPYGDACRGCKVLLTSREHDVLSRGMDTQKNFHVQHLCEEEAWNLFKKTAGDSVEKLELLLIAIEIVKKCKGLPDAIVRIAKALKGESVAAWKNALEELGGSALTNIREVSKNVYSCLELSYNQLEGDEVKRLFLLCGMLGYGDISLDQLLKYGMGLDLFEHVSSLEQIRNKLLTLVEILKDYSLLLDVEDKYDNKWPGVFFGHNDENKFVRMHDVVGDVARGIAAKDPHRFVVIKEVLGFEEWQRKEEFRNCSRVSLICNDLHELPERLLCPELEFFLLNGNDPSLRIPNTFFEETELLRVLALSKMHLTPSSLGFLSNLRTLHVYRSTLEDTAVIGELKKLQVLSFASCEIELLPKEMKQLTDLRVLDLWDCSHLQVIPRNVISSLSRLEHLCLAKSFTKWGAEGFGSGESNNACLSELNNLSYLKSLCIEIRDPNLLSKDLVFEKLTRYLISVSPVEKYVDYNISARTLKLCRVNKPCLVDCSSNLFKTVEDLELSDLEDTKHVLYELDTDDFLQLKRLDISRWAGIQYIVDSTKGVPSHSAFPILEKLFISGLQNMDAVCYGPIPEGSFGKLRSLTVYDCKRLKSFISLPMEQGRNGSVLPEMGFLDSTRDFSSTGASATQELSTSDVPSSFFNAQVAFPSLEELDISNLDNLEIWHNHEFIADSFGNLKRLSVRSCQKLRNVIPSYMLKRLQSLEILKIVDSNSVKEVFDLEAIDSKETHDIPSLQLRELCLDNLKNLKCLWNKASQGLLTYHNLKSVQVSHCPSLKIPFPGFVVRSLLQVKDVNMNSGGVEGIVAHEDVAKVVSMFLFPEVTSLANSCLKELKCFYLGLHNLEWPMLKRLEVESYESLEMLASELDKPVEQPIFLCDKVAFPILRYLNLSLKLKEIQDLQPLFGAFSNLRILIIENCPFLSNVLSSNFAQSLSNLRELTVKKCDLLEEVFDLNGVDDADNEHVEILSKLEKLSLIDLPMLRYICNNSPRQFSCFRNLESVRVKQCDSLMYLFSASMALGVMQLQDLCIEHCSTMKVIVMEDSNTDFRPQLFSCFKNLELVRVKQCDSLMYLFSASMALGVVKLKHLRIENCPMIEEIVIAENGATDKITFPQMTQLSLLSLPNLTSFYLRTQNLGVLFNEEVAFPKLESLYVTGLDNVKKIWQNQLFANSFSKLKEMMVENCNELQNILTSKNWLPSLESLTIDSCDELKVVFDLEVINVPEDVTDSQPSQLGLDDLQNIEHMRNKVLGKKLCLRNLKFLKVHNCGSLKMLFSLYTEPEGINEIIRQGEGAEEIIDKIEFPELRSLLLESLPSLASFYPGSHTLRRLGLGDHDILTPVLFSEKVAFPNLKYLHVSGLDNVKKIWHTQLLGDSFSKLKKMEVENCNELQNLLTSNVLNWLPSLEFLKIDSCGKLKEVFDQAQLSQLVLDDLQQRSHMCKMVLGKYLCLQNLKVLEVHNCGSMKNIFSPDMALGLVRLEGTNEIIEQEDGADEVIDKIEFPKLTSLSLKSLPSLASFYPGSHTLRMVGPGDHDILITVLFHEKVAFPNLEYLHVSGLDNVKKIWHNQLLGDSFSKLKKMEVENCNELQNLLTSNVLNWLPSLEFLKIDSCGKLKEVFDQEVINVQEDVTDTQLSQLVLDDLQQRSHMCKKVLGKYLCLQNLKALEVHNCGSMKNIFSPDMALGLVRLEGTNEIIEQEDGADEVIDKIEFPELTSLSLKSLPSLASFYPGSHTLRMVSPGDHDILITVLFHEKVAFPNLEYLHVSGLDNVKKIWHNQLLGDSFSKLKKMEVENCNELQNLLTSNVLNWLPSLEFLKIDSCGKLKEVFDQAQLSQLVLDDLQQRSHMCKKVLGKYLCLQNLKALEVHNCGSMKNIFSPDMALGLVRLEGTNEIIEQEDGADEVIDKIEFPELTSLSLKSLPSLASFYPGSHTLRMVSPGDHDILITVLFHEKVAFPNLEYLHVSGLDNVKKIWHNQLLGDSFSKLKKMEVENCNELQNLLTSNVLNWLPSLEFLKIDSCGKLKEVFDQEVINVQEDVTDTQLSQLVLDDLQQRSHMCNKVLGKYLCLQNLKVLDVHNCGSMKNIFSPDMALGLVRLEGTNEIIGQEDEAEEVIDKIEFPELTSLSLKSLPSLASFYPGSHTLRRVGPGDHGILTTVLFNEKVAFPSLESLNISGLGRMQKIWHNKLIENSFSKLAKMKVECCDELQNCLPLFVLKSSSLQILRIANCGKLKEAFDLEGTDILDDVTETQLNELVLHYLPQLQYIWNRDPYGILTYENLELVEVHHCQVLKVQFPSPLPRDLSQLKKQLIRSHWTKDLREKDKGKDFVFPEVTYNELELPDLRKIKGKEVVVVGGSDYVGEISGDMPGSSG